MNSLLKRIAWPIMMAPVVYLAVVWNRLPEKLAMHFDLQGNADRYGNKNELITMILILLGTNILLYLVLVNIYRIDPKKYAFENKDRLNKIAFAVAVFLAGITCLLIYSSSSGSIKISIGLIFSGTGLLIAIIGNYMPNLKPNYFAGFRLPWTLENPDNWKKTHLLGGRIWFAGGIFLTIVCLFLSPVLSIIIFFTVITIMVIIPCVFSYRYYKQSKAR